MEKSKIRLAQPIAGALIASALIFALMATSRDVKIVTADHGSGSGRSYTFLQAGFRQEIVGVIPVFLGGVAFAPDGDPLVTRCFSSSSPLLRFDLQAAAPEVNGTRLHPVSTLGSNAGCGITNHQDGNLYTNTGLGVIRLNANTGAQTGGPFGPAGNALGIAPDPQTGNLVYVGNDGTIRFVNPALTASGVFSAVTTGNFVDGIFFDPTGNFLFLANRRPVFRLTILSRTGALVQHVPMSSEPDGIAFHATTPKFVVTNNIDGTITRFDFPGDNFTQFPTQSVFASGGFRGDLSQVGQDGCLYLTQNGTRYDNNVTTVENSLVRICPGFAPPVPPVGRCTIPDVVTARPGRSSGFVISNDGRVSQTVTVRPFFSGACFSLFPEYPQQVAIAPGESYPFTINARNCPSNAGSLPPNSLIVVETTSCGTKNVQIAWMPQR